MRNTNSANHAASMQRQPYLTVEREEALVQAMHNGDEKAREELIASHFRLCNSIAYRFRGYGIPHDDLLSEAIAGLIKSVDRFKLEKGVRLSTYAMWWIRAAITEYCLRDARLVKLGTTRASKALYFSMNKIKRELGIISESFTHEEAEKVAARLGVKASEVLEMESRLQPDVSLNAPNSNLKDGEEREWQEVLADENVIAADDLIIAIQDNELVAEAIKKANLTERELDILLQRMADPPATLESLSEKYGVSRERIRSIQQVTLLKIQFYSGVLPPTLDCYKCGRTLPRAAFKRLSRKSGGKFSEPAASCVDCQRARQDARAATQQGLEAA